VCAENVFVGGGVAPSHLELVICVMRSELMASGADDVVDDA
jgi:hypothetical protein